MNAIVPAVAKIVNDAEAPGWPTPEPLPSGLLPVASFDNELLPESIRAWVADVADRMQCPPDFPAVGAMVALSSVIGCKACIRPKRQDDWRVVPNLWAVVVGRPGFMKSPALSEVTRPLDRLDIDAKKQFDEIMGDYDTQKRVHELSIAAAEGKAKAAVGKGETKEAERILRDAANASDNAKPVQRRYKVNDTTVEALGEILIENPWGVLAYRDELNGLLRSLDKEGQEGSRAFYLQGYDGNQSYTFDRISRGRYLHIPSVCISMLGGIQPGKLEAYIRDAVKGGSGDDGLLQRFGLLVWPDVVGEWHNVDRWPDTPAKNAAFDVFKMLDAMQPGVDEHGEPAPVEYRFDDAAQTLFDEWRALFEAELRTGEHHPAMESHLAKYRKLVPAIALVCALVDGETVVSERSLMRALAWVDYLRSHAARAYAAGTRPATQGAKSLLIRISKGDVSSGFKAREIYRNGWTNLSTPEDVQHAADLLADHDYLRRIEIGAGMTGGRPTVSYLINPCLLKGG